MKFILNKKKLIIAAIVFLLAIAVVTFRLSRQKSQPHNQSGLPNVLLISLDACRADHLSCYGYHRKTSPFIDEIAAGGILFQNAFVNTHGTPPSHATILSSLYQETHKVDYDVLGQNNLTHTVPSKMVMLQSILKDHGYTTLAAADGGLLKKKFGFNRGFDEYYGSGGGVKKVSKKLVKFVKKHIYNGKPIFAFYHTYEIHSPYYPPAKYKTMFGEYKSKLEPSSKKLLEYVKSAQSLSKQDLQFLNAMYDSEIRYTDDILRGMFEQLDEVGFFKNYILIITSDHGEEFGEHGGLLHRENLYDDLIYVPFIVAGTNLPSGEVRQTLVSSIDIAPTILGHLGIAVSSPMMGQNLLSPTQPAAEEEQAVFSQYGNLRYSIRTHQWKFIQNPKTVELYDLKKDPREQKNLAGDFPDICTDFQNRLQKWKDNLPGINIKVQQNEKLSSKDIDELKALGYIE